MVNKSAIFSIGGWILFGVGGLNYYFLEGYTETMTIFMGAFILFIFALAEIYDGRN